LFSLIIFKNLDSTVSNSCFNLATYSFLEISNYFIISSYVYYFLTDSNYLSIPYLLVSSYSPDLYNSKFFFSKSSISLNLSYRVSSFNCKSSYKLLFFSDYSPNRISVSCLTLFVTWSLETVSVRSFYEVKSISLFF